MRELLKDPAQSSSDLVAVAGEEVEGVVPMTAEEDAEEEIGLVEAVGDVDAGDQVHIPT